MNWKGDFICGFIVLDELPTVLIHPTCGRTRSTSWQTWLRPVRDKSKQHRFDAPLHLYTMPVEHTHHVLLVPC